MVILRMSLATALVALLCVTSSASLSDSIQALRGEYSPSSLDGDAKSDERTVKLQHLTVEYLSEPLGVDVASPRFSWVLMAEDSAREVVQSSYTIIVTDRRSRDVVWRSTATSAESTLVSYDGDKLEDTTTYDWSVQVEVHGSDMQGNAWTSTATETSFFSTGLSAWDAHWVTASNAQKLVVPPDSSLSLPQDTSVPDNLFRHEFVLDESTLVEATAYVASYGYYELFLNGEKVGKNKLDAGWTTYSYRVLYSTYDVTDLVKQAGPNAVGVMLGKGWGDQRAFICQIVVKDAHGSTTVVSDSTWKSSKGPITYDDIYNGESYDARLEQDGWTEFGFDDSDWTPVVNWDGHMGTLSSQLMPPVQVIEEIQPIDISNPKPGMYVIDFGQNLSGWCKLSVTGRSGTEVTLRHAEILMHPPYGEKDGTIYVGNLRSAKATDRYTLGGAADGEVYEPRFTYHGFRYVEVTGLSDPPTFATVVAVHVRSAVEQSGQVSGSHPLLNKLQRNIIWGQQTNLMSVPTDCDQRDERKGWMGDAALTAEEAVFNFQIGAFYTNFLRDIRDSQLNPNDPHGEGEVPDTVPHTFGGYPADPAWGTAYPTIALMLMAHYGDTRVVEEHWEGLTAYMNMLAAKVAQTGLAKMFSSYGDWVPPRDESKIDNAVTSSFSYITDARSMAVMAAALGKDSESKAYSDLSTKLAAEYNSAFYDSATKSYGKDGYQTGLALGLVLDIVPEEDKQAALDNLVKDIQNHDNHLTTGIIGTKALLEALSLHGRSDVALQLATQTTYPSWGYMMLNDDEPATTLWELWYADSEGPGMNSRNHIMFGSIGGWFYTSLAGLQLGRADVADFLGFDHFLVQPSIVDSSMLTHYSASTQTLKGQVKTSWQRPQPSTCATGAENAVVTLECPGSSISSVEFASFGNPTGDCAHDNFAVGTCNANSTLSVVKERCLNKETCTINASNDEFGGDPCYGTLKSLGVKVQCAAIPDLILNVAVPENSRGAASPPLSPTNIVETVTDKCVVKDGEVCKDLPAGVSGVTKDADGNFVVLLFSGDYTFASWK